LNNQKQIMLGYSMYATDNNDTMLGNTPPNSPVDLPAGGYWLGPQPGVTAGTTVALAMERAIRGMSNSPLTKYVPAVMSHQCPGDLRTRYRKPGSGWAFGSYSKTECMNGGSSGNYWPGTTPYKKLTDVQRLRTRLFSSRIGFPRLQPRHLGPELCRSSWMGRSFRDFPRKLEHLCVRRRPRRRPRVERPCHDQSRARLRQGHR